MQLLSTQFWQSHAFCISSTACHEFMITQALIMLGSNDNANHRLNQAIHALKNIAHTCNYHVLYRHISQDHKCQSPNNYHNQAMIIAFSQPMAYVDLLQYLKKIERQCGRDENKNQAKFGYLVALDLDILAVFFDKQWHKISERLPLKTHEKRCLNLE